MLLNILLYKEFTYEMLVNVQLGTYVVPSMRATNFMNRTVKEVVEITFTKQQGGTMHMYLHTPEVEEGSQIRWG